MHGLSHNEGLIGIGVSKSLGVVKRSLIEAGNELERESHTRIASFIGDSLNELESHICRIAFIGQVKAGKSSLINALIHRPHFLPTDVNPSTAVVTKVFLNSSAQPNNSALFHFFTEDEWDNLVSDKPTERPRSNVFSLPSTRKKLGELQKRAETRLGRSYNSLLGKHHLFQSVTPKILEQYVSTGDQFGHRGADTAQVYSDLTTMAEVFLDGPSNAYPSVLIDTPGVNDLFFIRDEITYANLADADIYVLVLTAQQPLSGGDLSILRLLRGLQKDKIIVVVNRIDSLGQVSEDIVKLEAFVRETLNRECPQTVIPVVHASALWANIGLDLGTAHSKSPITKSFIEYAEKLGYAKTLSDNRISTRKYFEPVDRELLIQCSGITRTLDMIGSLISNSVIEGQLLPCAATFAAIASNAATSSRFGQRALSPKKTFSAGAASDAEIKQRLFATVTQLDALVRDIEALLAGSSKILERTIEEEGKELERYLVRTIRDFAAAQSEAYFSSSKTSFLPNFCQAALAFRSDFADEFARNIGEISKSLADKHREAESTLRLTIKAILPTLDNIIQFGMSVPKKRSPSIVALGKATTLETPEYWEWLESASVSVAIDDGDLSRMIASEFILILNTLLESTHTELRLSSSDGIRRLRLVAFSAVFPVVEQVELIMKSYQTEPAPPKNAIAPPHGVTELGKYISDKIGHYERLSLKFNELKKRCLLIPGG